MRQVFGVGSMFLSLTACGPADTDPGPGGVTVGEARALDEAAEMLEERRLPEAALHTGRSDDASQKAEREPES